MRQSVSTMGLCAPTGLCSAKSVHVLKVFMAIGLHAWQIQLTCQQSLYVELVVSHRCVVRALPLAGSQMNLRAKPSLEYMGGRNPPPPPHAERGNTCKLHIHSYCTEHLSNHEHHAFLPSRVLPEHGCM